MKVLSVTTQQSILKKIEQTYVQRQRTQKTPSRILRQVEYCLAFQTISPWKVIETKKPFSKQDHTDFRCITFSESSIFFNTYICWLC